ncbi:hypothetical protein ACFOED_07655 [Vulcaniibacterium thermophilum]|uniref:Secreted protein n=1 Tax=Vulcaniibacterium thermophilum TaxID=1169913 RepID=A0A918YZY8_9GAMM|nr:hypothetical protein [Vulcaniibacterium thermophilum]GHE31894.1 hypothetical protein GCM10007167_12370 [Vulcaniibacterium thermophilum]
MHSRLLVLGASLALALPAHAAPPAYVPIEQRLSAEQMRATGLDTLGADQLRALNAILASEQASVARQVEDDTVREQQRRGGLFDRDSREPIRSAIVGSFRGWSSGDVLRLENGQRWRVVDTPPMAIRGSLENPKVTIAPGFMGAWYLQVDGHSPKAKVKPVE